MFKPNTATRNGSISRQPHLIGCLIVLLSLFLPATALAGPPEPGYEGPEKCAECHSTETEAWQNSLHAKAMTAIDHELQLACGEEMASIECDCLSCHTTDFDPVEGTYAFGGVTCEACHGPYIEGHPKNGIMQLDVDSSVCSDCHVDTYAQWEESLHAQTGVQCIGCHLSHSQDFRLTDEALCGACHRDQIEDFAHTAHEHADVTCTDCHLSSVSTRETTPVPRRQVQAGQAERGEGQAAVVSTEASIGPGVAPSHRFTVVSSQACVSCHGQTIHEETLHTITDQATNVQLLTMADQAPELAAQLEAVEQTNKSLQVMTVVSLGLGMGIGGMLGIVFMLVVGYISQGRARK